MNANTATAAPAPAAALLRRASSLDTMVALVRREFWEHRSLWVAPLVTQGALLLCLIFGNISMGGGAHGMLTREQSVALLTIADWAISLPVFVVASICVGFYLLDCLNAERKDRSILFWKSLPVSDERIVASKFLVAAVVVPCGVLVLAIVSNLVFTAVGMVRMPGVLAWDTYEWLRTDLVLLISVVLAVLWYAPIAAAFLLLSAWLRRPLIWATLVPIVAPILERVALGTHYIMSFEKYRIGGIWYIVQQGHEKMFAGDRWQDLKPVGMVLSTFNIGGAFTTVDLWLGVIAAVAMAYGAARIRRYHDET
jgi:ABC-2 type transport system permease protein